MTARNENRPGYKKTKVGWIPEEWECVTLGKCFQLASGEARPTDMSSDFSHVSQVPVFGGNGVMGYTNKVHDTCKRIIIGRVGEKCGCVHEIDGPHYVTDNALYTKRWLADACLEYFAYYLKKYDLARLRNKGGQPLVSQKPIYALSIPLPPLSEQERIAEVLGAWDRAIGLTDRLIEVKQRLKKGLMQQLLTGRLRFPQFGKPTRKHGELPKGWATHEFSEFAGLRREQVSPQNHEQDFICVELEHLDQNSGRLLGFTSSQLQASTKNKFQVGDILFGKLRPYLRKFWLCDRDGVCSTEAWVIKARQSRCGFEYLFYLVQDNRFVSAANITSGSKMPRADWAIVSEQPFSIPSLAEQKKIATCLSACDREVQLLTKRRDCLQEQKRGLMQKLLAGEVRIMERRRG